MLGGQWPAAGRSNRAARKAVGGPHTQAADQASTEERLSTDNVCGRRVADTPLETAGATRHQSSAARATRQQTDAKGGPGQCSQAPAQGGEVPCFQHAASRPSR